MKPTSFKSIIFAGVSALLFLVLEIPSSADDARMLNAVSAVLERMLAGDIASARRMASSEASAIRASGGDAAKDPMLNVLDYLAGKGEFDRKLVAMSTLTRPDAWALASMASFEGSVASDGELDSERLASDLACYQSALMEGARTPYATKWRGRVSVWMEWCENGFLPSSGLEPLLSDKSHKIEGSSLLASSITELTVEAFIEARGKVSPKRPRLTDLNMPQKTVDKYLSSIASKEQRLAERQRITRMKDVKEYLVRIFERNPYTGKIRLSNGRVLSGTISLANEYKLIIKPPGGGKGTGYNWGDLSPQTFADILIYFAKQRLAISVANLSDREKKRHAAEDYLSAAVICDWIGRYGESLEYAQKAFELNPSIGESIKTLILLR